MIDYKERFESWQKAAKEKFEEIDKQLGLKDKLEESVKVAKETAQKGAEVLKDGVEKIKTEAEKNDVGKQAVKVAEETFKTAEETAKKAWEVSEPIREAAEETGEKFREVAEDTAKNVGDVVKDVSEKAGDVVKEAGKKAGEVFHVAGEKASEVFEGASSGFKETAKTASNLFNFGASWTKTLDSAWKGLSKTSEWVTENPLQAIGTGVSMVVGAGLGAGFTLVSQNWLFQSALPAWSVKKISEQFIEYLNNQEKLLSQGELSEAEAERIKFERDIVKFAGAPLLGAFSCGAGVMMWANMFNPKTITGFPISWLLGGNPLLEGVWLFGNGLVCFKVGYEFFMVSLEDQEEVQRIVKEIKGMLPQTN